MTAGKFAPPPREAPMRPRPYLTTSPFQLPDIKASGEFLDRIMQLLTELDCLVPVTG
jgi:hypothetical protein